MAGPQKVARKTHRRDKTNHSAWQLLNIHTDEFMTPLCSPGHIFPLDPCNHDALHFKSKSETKNKAMPLEMEHRTTEIKPTMYTHIPSHTDESISQFCLSGHISLIVM